MSEGLFYGLIFVLAIAFGVVTCNRSAVRRAQCEAKGGYYFNPQHGSVCLPKGSFIPLD